MCLTRESVVIKLRIWSKRLIPILPTKQLKAMRYELGDMIKQYPNIKHPLAKFANNYDCIYLFEYFEKVIQECEKRKINMNKSYNQEIIDIAVNKSSGTYDYLKDYTFLEDNNDYLKICLWNLYEKAIRNIITNEEWKPINDLFKEEI